MAPGGSGSAGRRQWPARLCFWLWAVLSLPALSAGADGSFEEGIDSLAAAIASALDRRDIGRTEAANIFLRPPFDAESRVVCPPLSRRLAEALRSRLPDAFDRARRYQAGLVQRQGDGPGQLVLLVQWRSAGERVALTFRLGDLSTDQIREIGGATASLPQDALSGDEAACLARLRPVNVVRRAERTLFVHRTPDLLGPVIARIETGEQFRLVGSLPWTGEDWAVVAPPTLGGDPFAEHVGFALVDGLGSELADRDRLVARIEALEGDAARFQAKVSAAEDRSARLEAKLAATVRLLAATTAALDALSEQTARMARALDTLGEVRAAMATSATAFRATRERLERQIGDAGAGTGPSVGGTGERVRAGRQGLSAPIGTVRPARAIAMHSAPSAVSLVIARPDASAELTVLSQSADGWMEVVFGTETGVVKASAVERAER